MHQSRLDLVQLTNHKETGSKEKIIKCMRLRIIGHQMNWFMRVNTAIATTVKPVFRSIISLASDVIFIKIF